MIKVVKVRSDSELKEAFKIRQKVFIDEQKFKWDEEFDEFDDDSVHYLAYLNDVPAGTARRRITEKGLKLERFAVYKEFRHKGIASALLNNILDEVASGDREKLIYMHSQLHAVSFYQQYGFDKEGEVFLECGAEHYIMILKTQR